MDSIKFWNQQILKWERDQFDWLSQIGFSTQTKSVQKEAFRIMTPILKNSTVVEFGCGTARLMLPILEAGATKYIGVDSSTAAIQVAQNRVTKEIAQKIDLICSPLSQLGSIPMDFSFSLFLLDWVDPKELAKLSAPLFLHSFTCDLPSSRIRNKIKQLRYGPEYMPKTYTEEELKKEMNRTRLKIHSSPRMGSIKLIHNLL